MSPFSCQLKMPLSKPFALGFKINLEKPQLEAQHNFVTYYKMSFDLNEGSWTLPYCARLLYL